MVTTYSIRVYRSLYPICNLTGKDSQYTKNNSTYYAGIMLNAFFNLLCSKLCQHNWRKPIPIARILTDNTLLVTSKEKKKVWRKNFDKSLQTLHNAVHMCFEYIAYMYSARIIILA